MPWQPEPAPAVLVSANTRLIEWVGRLAATVGCGLEVAGPPWAGRSSPDRTPPRLILVGADLDPTQDLSCGVTGAPPGAASARADPPDAAVVVVAQEPVPAQVWQRALAVGARQVAVLPDAQAWLLECLAEAAEPATRRCPVLGVIGGRGGAGASVLAAAAARAASGLGARTLLIDADPLGGGVDLLLGAEDEPGARWPDLATARGWIQPGPLLAGLPKADGLSFLSWARDAGEVPVEAMAAVLSGARYGCDLVVADLARGLPAGTGVVARACTRIILVSPAEVRAAAAARSVQAGPQRSVGRDDRRRPEPAPGR
jgi:secretion/DNA translocation related CpaE-like protein